jgi:hypothetical protein
MSEQRFVFIFCCYSVTADNMWMCEVLQLGFDMECELVL